MKHLFPVAVAMLMVSIGMSLNVRQFVANWGRLTPGHWARLLLATFLVPPLLALGLGRGLALGPAATVGLFLVAVAPGAPLMMRGAARKGFDLQMAASYQVWGALLTPVMVPLLVGAAGAWQGRGTWVPPLELLGVIARQQFLPLMCGALLARWMPGVSARVQRGLNLAGNALLLAGFVAVLWRMGPALGKVSPRVAVAAVGLAAGCVLAVRWLVPGRASVVQTLAVSNANRHVGLALLLSGQHIHDTRPVPAIAAYALAAAGVMLVYARLARRAGTEEGA